MPVQMCLFLRTLQKATSAADGVGAHEPFDTLSDELDGNGGEQQSKDSGEHLDAARSQQLEDLCREPKSEVDADEHRDERSSDAQRIVKAMRFSREHDRRGNRSWSGNEGSPERDERHIRLESLLVGALALDEKLQGDQEQEKPAGALKRRDRDTEITEDLLSEQRKQGDDRPGSRH